MRVRVSRSPPLDRETTRAPDERTDGRDVVRLVGPCPDDRRDDCSPEDARSPVERLELLSRVSSDIYVHSFAVYPE